MADIQVSEGLLQQLLQWSEAKNPDEALREAIDAFIRLRKRKYLQDLKGNYYNVKHYSKRGVDIESYR